MPDSRNAGHYHPLTIVTRDMERIFSAMGFEVVQGPEIEDEYHNFDALNMFADHPARDMQDTFWVKSKERKVLRTQTSNTQIRYMEENDPPIRIIAPGRVYRNEATDARHEAIFHQIEGLAVDKNITLADLKGTLLHFLKELFGSQAEIRVRPGYFPFVEPGLEVDTTCPACGGRADKCSVCKASGWLELMGAGMVHPKVLMNGGINPREYQGFAFGVGIERLAMVKYGIDDIRLFNTSDLRFVNQF